MMIGKRVVDGFGHLQLSRSVFIAPDHRPFQQAPGSENIAHAGAAVVRVPLWNRFRCYFVEFLRAGVSSGWRRLSPRSVLLLQRDVHALPRLLLALLLDL
jgi:hypothetical protein